MMSRMVSPSLFAIIFSTRTYPCPLSLPLLVVLVLVPALELAGAGGEPRTRPEYPGTMDHDANELDTSDDRDAAVDSSEPNDAIVDELLIEEISIDGMCGVY